MTTSGTGVKQQLMRDSSIDVGSQTLISANRQFEKYAPIFNKADPYDIQTRAATSINAYGSSTMMSDTLRKSERPNRFGFTRKTGGGATSTLHSAYNDNELNERDEGFDMNREMALNNTTMAAGKSSGLP